ncbi:MAG TPA: FMN-binding protein [Pedococcus sp.]|nr:FMN-binding protein [Pedococcus sp.]
MRRITLWLLGTMTSVVLLFSYHTSTSSAGAAPTTVIAGQASGSGQTDSGTSSGSTSSGSSGQSSSGSSGSSGSSSGSSGSSSAAAAKTYAGDTAQTQWGPVQVQITVKNGKITASDVLQVPSGNPRDDEINSYAVPVLDSEVVGTQNANIDMVSGATVTSDGYIQSLQSALDQAGL